jgi:ABC-type cobalamin/Fe3+-siderophores transport system ATPase subunit
MNAMGIARLVTCTIETLSGGEMQKVHLVGNGTRLAVGYSFSG